MVSWFFIILQFIVSYTQYSEWDFFFLFIKAIEREEEKTRVLIKQAIRKNNTDAQSVSENSLVEWVKQMCKLNGTIHEFF